MGRTQRIFTSFLVLTGLVVVLVGSIYWPSAGASQDLDGTWKLVERYDANGNLANPPEGWTELFIIDTIAEEVTMLTRCIGAPEDSFQISFELEEDGDLYFAGDGRTLTLRPTIEEDTLELIRVDYSGSDEGAKPVAYTGSTPPPPEAPIPGPPTRLVLERQD
ncbi:MAG: hypothetical protein ACYS99_15380 [Planctomycetota bacterium]|jgi:hypothetical protein